MATSVGNIQQRRGTAVLWSTTNPVPLAGEWCIESDTGGVKLGDGITTWNNLEYRMLPGTSSFDFSASGALTVVTLPMNKRVLRTIHIAKVYVSVNTAPVGAAVIIDVLKNGASIFATSGNRPQIAAGSTVGSSASPDVTTVNPGDYLKVAVTQVGSTTPGSDLFVQVAY